VHRFSAVVFIAEVILITSKALRGIDGMRLDWGNGERNKLLKGENGGVLLLAT
jgi:hypothetical protein